MANDELDAAPNDEMLSFDCELVDELLRELLDDRTPFIFPPEENQLGGSTCNDQDPHLVPEATFQLPLPVSPNTHTPCTSGLPLPPRLRSAAYSGPTVHDIQSALSAQFQAASADVGGGSRKIHRPEWTSPLSPNGGGNKYFLKVRHTGEKASAPNDGYKWRKYGQKSIKNSPNPRSYYKCANPHCGAKKQVERSPDNPALLLVTYEGLHQHHAFMKNVHTRTTGTPKRSRATAKQADQPSAPGKEEVQSRRTVDGTRPEETDKRPESLLLEDDRKDEQQPGGLLEDIFMGIETDAPTTDTEDCASSSLMAEHYSPPYSPYCSSFSSFSSPSLHLPSQLLDEGMLFSCFF